MSNPSQLILEGEKSIITIDADAGGIFITPKNSRRRSLCLYAGRDDMVYIGGYGADAKPSVDACDFAIGADEKGKATIQGRDSDGNIVIRSLGDILKAFAQPVRLEIVDKK